MMKRFFISPTQSITSAAIVIGGASFASRIIGVLRDRVLASSFGAGETLDVYYAAFRVPDFVFQLLVAGALSAGFIPLFVARFQESKESAYNFSNAVLIFIGIMVLGISFAGILTAQWFVPLVVPGFGGNMLTDTIMVTRIMFLSPILLGISAVFGGILQAQKRFFAAAAAPIFYNFGIIFGTLFLAPRWGVFGLAGGVVIGAFFHMLVHIPALRAMSFSFHIRKPVFSKDIRRLIRLMIPRVLTLGAAQINLLVITMIASTISVGGLAVFNWAHNLQSFPLGIFGVSFAIAAFPTLTDLAVKDQKEMFVVQFLRVARQMLFFLIPSTLLLIILRAQIVRVILGAGVFDWTATVLTMDTLALLSIGLGAQALVCLLARAFFAFSETKLPLYSAIIATTIHILLAFWMARHYGIVGLGFSFSLSNIVQCGFMWLFLRQKVHSLHEKDMVFHILKLMLPSLALVLVTQALKTQLGHILGTDTFIKVLLQGSLSGIGGILVFGIVGYILRVEELRWLLGSLQRRWLHLKQPVDIEQNL